MDIITLRPQTKAGKGWGGRGGGSSGAEWGRVGSSGAEWGREGVGQSLEYDFITLIPLNNTTKPKAGKGWGGEGTGVWGGGEVASPN